MAPGPVEQIDNEQAEVAPAKLPKGMVLGPDGKPCRSCTSGAAFKAWTSMAKGQPSPKTTSAATLAGASASAFTEPIADDCPPDVEVLGRSSWTLLHSITATYPITPSPQLQSETKTFLNIFSKLYPCWHCASDFQSWMRTDGNAPRVSSREEFGQWMCEAHNAVNVKLGKKEFDCGRWEERWRTGWKDGRCD